ncbi:hypothetical protein FRC07_001491 [Ceratobasidium sp. 392]|nr:hypothetical protein FRC07_001491 [Ceratobasidium sp. 392]
MCAQHTIRTVSRSVDATRPPIVASSEPSFRFTPPAEGDIAIVSSDGVKFLAHSNVLELSSSVFADMLSIGTKSEQAAELAEDAESISLMLAFIYAPDFLSIREFSLLEKMLNMARKYDIHGATKKLDDTIPEGAHANFISINPLRVFQLGTEYGLQNTSRIAAEAIQRQYRRFEDSEAINEFTKRFPDTAPLMAIVGTIGARAKVLHSVLYNFDSGLPPLDSDIERDPDAWTDLMCTKCYKDIRFTTVYQHMIWRPHWLADWARLAFDELLSKDVDECNDLFEASVFSRMRPNSSYPYCIKEVSHRPALFNAWAENVKLKLNSELFKLELLG